MARAAALISFGGTVANTIDAHMVVQWVQETKREEAAMKVVECE